MDVCLEHMERPVGPHQRRLSGLTWRGPQLMVTETDVMFQHLLSK